MPMHKISTVYSNKKDFASRSWSQLTSSSAIAERPRCRVVSYGQKWKTGTGRQYLRTIYQYSTTATYLASKDIEIGEKTPNNGYYAVQGHPRSSKVIEVGTNRKPVCDFLLVINSNWHSISCRFGDIAGYCSNFGHFAFFSHPLGA